MEEKRPEEMEELKSRIVKQIADLSRLLGEIPGDHQSIKDARDSFLKLSVLVGRALELDLS